MAINKELIFSLDNFNGSLSLLWLLLKRRELRVQDLSIADITQQYRKGLENLLSLSVDAGVQYLDLAAALIELKSQKILLGADSDREEKDLPGPLDLLDSLIDYCRFKDLAKQMQHKELSEFERYSRGGIQDEPEEKAQKQPPKKIGIEHLSIDDLSLFFKDLIARADERPDYVKPEKWLLKDKIQELKAALKENSLVPFTQIFVKGKSKQELIVLFLAVLDLMKSGDLQVLRKEESVFLADVTIKV